MELVKKNTERLILSPVFVGINKRMRSDPNRQERCLVSLPSNPMGKSNLYRFRAMRSLRWIAAGGLESMP